MVNYIDYRRIQMPVIQPADAVDHKVHGSGAAGATAWITTTPGLEAVMPDGTRLAPPWAN
jgi:hypothetical protein